MLDPHKKCLKHLDIKKDEDSSHEMPTYKDEYRSLMFTKTGVVIIGKFKQIVSLTTEEIKAINKQMKELK